MGVQVDYELSAPRAKGQPRCDVRICIFSVSTSKVSTVWKRAAEVEWKLKVDLYEFQTVEV